MKESVLKIPGILSMIIKMQWVGEAQVLISGAPRAMRSTDFEIYRG